MLILTAGFNKTWNPSFKRYLKKTRKKASCFWIQRANWELLDFSNREKKNGKSGFMTLRSWAQEDVEEHSEEHKDYICHDTQPETRIFK